MKKNRVVCSVLALALMLQVSACGKQKEVTGEPEPTAAATEQETAEETTEETAATETTETTEADTTEAIASTEEGTTETTEAASEADSADATEKPQDNGSKADNSPQEQKQEETQPAQQRTEDELQFSYNNATVRLGDNAKGFVDAAAPDYEEAAPSCYGDGEDINYHYPDFTLFVWNSNDSYLLYGIDITGGSTESSRGIHVGSSKDDVIAAYGTNYSEDGSDIVYTYGDCNLRFTIKDGSVTYISYNKEI
ncbi:MAG: hypothetical protein J5851_00920 [Oscillospiraceae bacterium]|nr:hypothetical protein [Oscillospiraceae bacterium]